MLKNIDLFYIAIGCLATLGICCTLAKMIEKIQNKILVKELEKLNKEIKRRRLNQDMLRALKEEEEYERRYGKQIYD